MCECAANLAFDHPIVQNCPAIMHCNVAVYARFIGQRINLDTAEVKDKGMAQRRIDPVFVGRRRKFRRGPDRGFAQGRINAIGQGAGGPMPRRCNAGKGHFGLGVGRDKNLAIGKFKVVWPRVQLACRDLGNPVAQTVGGQTHGTGRRGGKAA